jgi:hypothetical protein
VLHGEIFSKLNLVLIALGGVFLYDETLTSGALFGFALILSTIFLNVTKVQFTWSKAGGWFLFRFLKK